MGGSSSKPGQVASSGTMEFVNSTIRDNKVVVFLKPNCPFCVRVKKLFGDVGVPIFVVDITRREDMSDIQSCLEEKTGARSVSVRAKSGDATVRLREDSVWDTVGFPSVSVWLACRNCLNRACACLCVCVRRSLCGVRLSMCVRCVCNHTGTLCSYNCIMRSVYKLACGPGEADDCTRQPATP